MEHKSTMALLFRAFALFILGFIVMLYTDEALKNLTLIPGLVITVIGIAQTLFSYGVRKKLMQWQWYVAGGIGVLAIGIILMLNPGLTLRMLTAGIGVYFVYQAAVDFMALKPWKATGNKNAWYFGLLGGIEAILGLLLVIDPLGDAMRDTVFIGSVMVVGAIAAFVTSRYLRKGYAVTHADEA